MGFMDREPDKSEVESFLWKIRVGHECEVMMKGVLQFMMEAIKAVIVRLHAKRKTVAACEQTVATQQLLWRLDSQAALLEEHVNEYRAELEREAVEEARTEAEEPRDEQIQAALLEEQTQGALLEQYEVAEMDGLLVRGDAAEMREWL